MSSSIVLTCPACGGKLEITNDIERFACAHCGREHVVRRGAGIVSLSPVVDAIKKVETGVDKTASELAIARLQREIDDLENGIHEFWASNPPTPPSLVGYALGIFGVILTMIALANIQDNGLGSLALGIVMTGSGFLWIYVKSVMNRGRERELEEQLEPICEQLAEKRAEQEKHRQVVSQ